MADEPCPCCAAKQRAELVAREWERQSKQWEKSCKALRNQIAALEVDNDRLRAETTALSNDIAQAQHERDSAEQSESEMTWTLARVTSERDELARQVQALEHRLGEAHQGLTVAEEGGT